MNTPFPCDRCKHNYYDCMSKDDPSYSFECMSDTGKEKIGDPDCPCFEDENGPECMLCGNSILEGKEVMVRAPFSNEIWCEECLSRARDYLKCGPLEPEEGE